MAVRTEDHARLKQLSKDLDRPMAVAVALLISGWERLSEDDRRDLLDLPPLLDGPYGKLGEYLSRELS